MSTYDDVKNGNRDHSTRFGDLRKPIRSLGFAKRMNGSHHVYTKAGLPVIITLQADGAKAKAYQVRSIINQYGLEVKQMSKYEMRISWDASDSIYVVEVPELSRCMAHGATPGQGNR